MASVLPWDQSTFTGRLNYYARVTDPRLMFASTSTLDRVEQIVKAKKGDTLLHHVTKKEVVRAHVIYNSAFHPDTGDRMNVIGRMSAQVPCGMMIIGGMMVFYKTTPQVIGMQFINQTFNAIVNYTNRNAKSQTTNVQIASAYIGATSGAVFASVGLNSLLVKAPTLLKRWVPLVAVMAANCVNIPTMRQRELIDGILVTDKDGNTLGRSRKAAVKGIGQVLLSRLFLVTPVMLFIPTLMQSLEKLPFFKRGLFVSAVTQMLLSGCFLLATVPSSCSLFPQQCSLRYDQLETSLQQEIRKKYDHQIDRVYFNKGL
ncbi:sideroflexin-2-like [Dysidea avara]|uniref:sideroflexin-2-like n=1 Tax=Dysidea avara TaxID=196820 RepID=UPI003332B7CE